MSVAFSANSIVFVPTTLNFSGLADKSSAPRRSAACEHGEHGEQRAQPQSLQQSMNDAMTTQRTIELYS